MKILEALEAATQKDWDEIKESIVEKEKELAALHRIERILKLKFNGVEPRKPRSSKGTGNIPGDGDIKMEGKRRKVAQYLMANGPKSQVKLSEVTSINRQGPGSIYQIVNHAWFHVAPDGIVSVTATGEAAIRKLV